MNLLPHPTSQVIRYNGVTAFNQPNFHHSLSCKTGTSLADVAADLSRESLLQSIVPYANITTTTTTTSTSFASPSGIQSHNRGTTAVLPSYRFPRGYDSKSSSPSRAGRKSAKGAKHHHHHHHLHHHQTSPSAVNSTVKTAVTPVVLDADVESEMMMMKPSSGRSVTIHVCDDSRAEKRDFVCPQELLLGQMGYFRDITAGQSLEDVDISVHCDIAIFDWLMTWMRKVGDNDDEEEVSSLEPGNVMSILVSASFLKMTGLVDECLQFAHDNMNKILAVSHSLSCLGEPLLSRLALLYKVRCCPVCTVEPA